MDLDIEMDVDVDEGHYNAPIPEAYTHDIITGEEQEPGEVDEGEERTDNHKDTAIVPFKIHIRGLDTFNPDDVKAYVAQHFSAGQFERIEWVDDSSANLLFRSESVATEALVALSTLAIVDPSSLPPLEALPAKQYAPKPDSVLQVRFAVEGDKKATGAAQQSRFYLLHPEYDPEERRRRTDYGRTRYRDRDDAYRGNRRGGRDGRRRDHHQEDIGSLTFDASLYDDDTSALAQRSSVGRDKPRRQSTSSDSVHSDRYRPNSRQNREKELFPGRLNASSHRDRARSASPGRDRDGDAHMGEDDKARAAAAMRNREKGRSIKERLIKETTNRENTPRELFPEKSHGSKELFPSKVSSGLGSKAQMDQVDDTTILASAKLADRITARPTSTTYIPPSGGDGLNIRGLANRTGASGSGSGGGGDRQGIAIKGKGATVKELFPDKFGSNAAKELFAEKLEGRGQRRQRAEDMFY